MSVLIPDDPSQADPKVIKVMKAIKQIESGGNFSAVGDNGQSHGAYQWNKNNFKNQATQYGLDPNDMSPENQNKVAYARIKQLKDEGRTPDEVAAIWNGAHKQSDGTFTYNNPKYGEKFHKALGEMGGSQGYNPTPFSNPSSGQFTDFTGSAPQGGASSQPQTGLGAELAGRGNDIAGAGQVAGQGVSDLAQGNILPGLGHLASGAIQGAGAIAGGVGDVVGAGLGLIPGVKQVEGAIGSGVSALAQTGPGQSVVQGVNDFSQAHPELAKDIGAGANIAGLVGGGIGGKVAKDVVGEGLYQAAKEGTLGAGLKAGVEKSAVKDATKILSSNPTKAEIKAAVRTGNTSVKGGVTSLLPDKAKQDSINAVAELIKSGDVSPKALGSANVEAIKTAADTEAQEMRKLINTQEVTQIAQPEDLTGMGKRVIDKAGSSITSGENPAKTLLSVFEQNLPKGKDITAEDILNARQAVGKYVLDNRGGWAQQGVLTGFKSARNAIWDESRDLLVKLAPGVPIRQMLAKQSALYRALDYIIPNVQSEIKGGVTAFGKAHPVLTGAKNLGKNLIKGAVKYGTIGAAAHLLP